MRELAFKPLAFVALLVLAGCGGGIERQRLIACDAWNQALKEFAIQRAAGKTSPDQVASVDALIPIAGAACQKTVADSKGSLADVQAAIDKLRLERAKQR